MALSIFSQSSDIIEFARFQWAHWLMWRMTSSSCTYIFSAGNHVQNILSGAANLWQYHDSPSELFAYIPIPSEHRLPFTTTTTTNNKSYKSNVTRVISRTCALGEYRQHCSSSLASCLIYPWISSRRDEKSSWRDKVVATRYYVVVTRYHVVTTRYYVVMTR